MSQKEGSISLQLLTSCAFSWANSVELSEERIRVVWKEKNDDDTEH